MVGGRRELNCAAGPSRAEDRQSDETAVVVRNCPAFASELAGKFNAYHRLSAPREAKGGVCKSPDGKTPSAWDHFLGNLLMGVL